MKTRLAGRDEPKTLEASMNSSGFNIIGLKPPKAGPLTRLSGRAEPGNHYSLTSRHVNFADGATNPT